MSNNLFNKLFDKTNKIYRESHQKSNTKFAEKFINFSFQNGGNFLEEISFESMGGFVEIIINFESESSIDFDVIFNDVVIQKVEGELKANYKYLLNCDSENLLQINVCSDDANFSIFQILIKGNVKNNEKCISNILNLDNIYYLKNTNYMTSSDDIMSISVCNNDTLFDNYDKYIDTNYTFDNATFLKNNIFNIYYDNVLKAKDVINLVEYNLGYDTDIACIVPSKIPGKNINIFYVLNGCVYVSNYSNDMTFVSSQKIDVFDNKKIVKMTSIISDDIVSNFLVKDTYDLWCFVEYDFATNAVVKTMPFERLDDLKVYYENSEVVCVEKILSGIVIKKFSDFSLATKTYEKQFLNVNDAYYHDDKIYLINQNNVQLVEV